MAVDSQVKESGRAKESMELSTPEGQKDSNDLLDARSMVPDQKLCIS